MKEKNDSLKLKQNENIQEQLYFFEICCSIYLKEYKKI